MALSILAATLPATAAHAQTTGSLLGRVLDAVTEDPVAGAEISVANLRLRSRTDSEGRFVLTSVPVGEHSVRVEMAGYQAVVTEGVLVRGGRSTELAIIRLAPAPVPIEGLVVRAERDRMVEPGVTASRELVLSRELRELPIDAMEEVLELATGVTEGHFRGGRTGQEAYVVDGVEMRNQLEASTQGWGLEFSPNALQEVEVITGGFGAQYGSALSGTIRLSTRRGNPERWDARVGALTDEWVPGETFRGYTALSASAGGPLPFLGRGTTLFTDVLLQGQLDADPRSRGATCLRPGDGDAALDDLLESLSAVPSTSHLSCPHTGGILPNQRGEKAIAFARLDRPLGGGWTLTGSILANRRQRQLYTSEFRYNPRYQLGQRVEGALALLSADWSRSDQGGSYQVTARTTLLRVDRHLGAMSTEPFQGRGSPFDALSGYRFLGEGFVRSPIQEQVASGEAVPGYLAPGGSTGSPFGPAGEGVFFTEGTPHLANWSRSDLFGADLVAERMTPSGTSLQGGVSARMYRMEQYERAFSHLAGSIPNYGLFFPATGSAFLETRLAAADEVTLQIGMRVDAFRPGIGYLADRADFLSPVIDAEWKLGFMPRIAIAGPLPIGDRGTAFRLSYSLLAQAPDFQFFLDTTIGDSLRTDIRRQGNPDLGFERGSAWEVGVERMVSDRVSLGLTTFLKELNNLTTGSVRFSGEPAGRYSTADFGMVRGAELTLTAEASGLRMRMGYLLQRAIGVGSTALEDTLLGSVTEQREFPLAFDRRHALTGSLWFGSAGGAGDSPWSGAVTAWARSGHPVDRFLTDGLSPDGTVHRGAIYLPWTHQVSARVRRDVGRVPLCGSCGMALVLEGRNVFGAENILAVRREEGGIAPSVDAVMGQVGPGLVDPIPMESPRYSALADLNRDGVISDQEYRIARIAAVLDRHDPSLYFGEPRQLRLGVEVRFR